MFVLQNTVLGALGYAKLNKTCSPECLYTKYKICKIAITFAFCDMFQKNLTWNKDMEILKS